MTIVQVLLQSTIESVRLADVIGAVVSVEDVEPALHAEVGETLYLEGMRAGSKGHERVGRIRDYSAEKRSRPWSGMTSSTRSESGSLATTRSRVNRRHSKASGKPSIVEE